MARKTAFYGIPEISAPISLPRSVSHDNVWILRLPDWMGVASMEKGIGNVEQIKIVEASLSSGLPSLSSDEPRLLLRYRDDLGAGTESAVQSVGQCFGKGRGQEIYIELEVAR